MGQIERSTTNITAVERGSTDVNYVYRGSTLVWQKGFTSSRIVFTRGTGATTVVNYYSDVNQTVSLTYSLVGSSGLQPLKAMAWSPSLLVWNSISVATDSPGGTRRLAVSGIGTSATYSRINDPVNIISGNSRRYAVEWCGGAFNRFLAGGFQNLIESFDGFSYSLLINNSTSIPHYPYTTEGGGGIRWNPVRDEVLITYGDGGVISNSLTKITMVGGVPTFSRVGPTGPSQDTRWMNTPGEYILNAGPLTAGSVRFWYSSDGTTWTGGHNPGFVGSSGRGQHLAYIPTLDRVVFGHNDGQFYTQPFSWCTASQAKPWTVANGKWIRCQGMASAQYRIDGMQWSSEYGLLFATDNNATLIGGLNFYLTSPNGDTWTVRSLRGAANGMCLMPGYL